jgi:phytanoyl-CoA hydroxylase
MVSKPSSSATSSRLIGKVVPPNAPEPNGSQFTRFKLSMTAWTAVDPSDEENGGIVVVPNTQSCSMLQCPHEADPLFSFTCEEVYVHKGLKPIPTTLDTGDVLFFNGNVIYGSYPNGSKNRFRCSFFCHHTDSTSTKIDDYYKPLYKQDGTEVTSMETNKSGGKRGTVYNNNVS